MIPLRLQAVERLAGVERSPARGDLRDGGFEIEGAGRTEGLAKRTRFLRGLARLRRSRRRVFDVGPDSARFEALGRWPGALGRPGGAGRGCGDQGIGRHRRGPGGLPPAEQRFDRFERLRGDLFAARNAALDRFGVRAQSFLKLPRGSALEAGSRRLIGAGAGAAGETAIAGAVAGDRQEQLVAGLQALGLRGVFGDRPIEPLLDRHAGAAGGALGKAARSQADACDIPRRALAHPSTAAGVCYAARAGALRLGRDHSIVTVKKRLRARLTQRSRNGGAGGCGVVCLNW